MRKLLRVEWMAILLIICIWFPHLCVFAERHQLLQTDPHEDVASPTPNLNLS